MYFREEYFVFKIEVLFRYRFKRFLLAILL